METVRLHCATGRPKPSAWAFGADYAKLIHLVRHAQGVHNVEAAARGAASYSDIKLVDARLDNCGREQATNLSQRMVEARLQCDVILVSPLRRTLETATLIYPDAAAAIKEAISKRDNKNIDTYEDYLNSLVPPTVPGYPRFVAIEYCREACGSHYCDKRSSVAELIKEFPHVDFSLIGTNVDTWHNDYRRETVREVALRADIMMDIIRERPERNIVVVSHGVFLETLLTRSSLGCLDEGVRNRRFENCELRSIVIGGWGQDIYSSRLPTLETGALSEIAQKTFPGHGSSTSKPTSSIDRNEVYVSTSSVRR